MTKRWYQYFCPCFKKQQTQIQQKLIEMPNLKNIRSSVSPVKIENQPSPNKIVQIFQLQQQQARFSKLSSDEFYSFNNGSSQSKKSLRIIKIQNKSSLKSSQPFKSIKNFRVQSEEDNDFGDIIQKIYNWIQKLPKLKMTIRDSDLLDLERVKKILILQSQNKIEEFEYFSDTHNFIYENKELQMEVELRQFPKVFQNKIYATLCKLRLKISATAFLTIFNSEECQSHLASFSSMELLSQEPYLLIKTHQISNFFYDKISLFLIKFSILMEQDTGLLPKKYLVDIESNVTLTESGYQYKNRPIIKRFTRISRSEQEQLQIYIYTEWSPNFKQGINVQDFFRNGHKEFAQYILKIIKS